MIVGSGGIVGAERSRKLSVGLESSLIVADDILLLEPQEKKVKQVKQYFI
jgi:hypothetical protein